MYNKTWVTRLFIVSITLVLLFLSVNVEAQIRRQNSLKFGLSFFSTFDTSLVVDNKDTGQRALNSDSLTGAIVFFERIVNNFFGYEARFGQFDQSLELKIDGIKSDITNAATIIGGSMRAYAQSHRRNGINYYGAVNIGLLRSTLSFIKAPPITLQGKQYSFNTYAIGVEGGFDYLIRFAGIRAAFGYQYGASTVVGSEELVYKVRYDLGSPYFNVGVFSFF